MATIYSLLVCEELISQYMKRKGDVIYLEEGSLGLGKVLLVASGLKTAIIKEVYLNSWSSGHTIRMYDKTPAKYKKLIDNI